MIKNKRWTSILICVVFLFHINFIMIQAEEYWPDGPEVLGSSMIVMEASTGTILYEKNANEKLYPASITKILTALLAIENSNLDEVVLFSHDSVFNIEPGSSHIGRDVDEMMTMEECLYGILLESANEVSYAVAEHVGTTYNNFIVMMNERAKSLGCENTNFVNPHGLPDENHYTTAYDMSLIAREAVQNETFTNISSTPKSQIPPTNKHDEITYLNNHHKMINNFRGDSSYLYEECIGGKNGYTTVAKNTLVTFAERNGMTLICVVMNEETPNHYIDTKTLFDYCFDNFKLFDISDSDFLNSIGNKELFKNKENFIGFDYTNQIVLPKAASITDVETEVTQNTNTENSVGILQFKYANRVVGNANIIITESKVQQFPFESMKIGKKLKNTDNTFTVYVEYLMISLIVLFIAITIIVLFYIRGKSNSSRFKNRR